MNDNSDDKLIQAAAELRSDISPERDLWPGIAQAIETPKRRAWSPVFAQAAAVVLLIGASSAVTYTVVTEQQPTVVPVNANMVFEQASFGNRYTLGPGFQDARDNLVAELEIELQRIPAESRIEIETSLATMQTAISSINEALQREPDNVHLQERLLNTYREELALLRRVGGLTRSVMNRNDI